MAISGELVGHVAAVPSSAPPSFSAAASCASEPSVEPSSAPPSSGGAMAPPHARTAQGRTARKRELRMDPFVRDPRRAIPCDAAGKRGSRLRGAVCPRGARGASEDSLAWRGSAGSGGSCAGSKYRAIRVSRGTGGGATLLGRCTRAFRALPSCCSPSRQAARPSERRRRRSGQPRTRVPPYRRRRRRPLPRRAHPRAHPPLRPRASSPTAARAARCMTARGRRAASSISRRTGSRSAARRRAPASARYATPISSEPTPILR
jgi:hypothetical protein